MRYDGERNERIGRQEGGKEEKVSERVGRQATQGVPVALVAVSRVVQVCSSGETVHLWEQDTPYSL